MRNGDRTVEGMRTAQQLPRTVGSCLPIGSHFYDPTARLGCNRFPARSTVNLGDHQDDE